MGVPLQAILAAKNVIGVIQTVKPGLQDKILPAGFLASSEGTALTTSTFGARYLGCPAIGVGDQQTRRTTACP